jgi:hypothetical protein
MTIEQHPSDVVLAAFAAGTLDEAQRIAIAAHVRGCARCRAFVRAMEHVGGIVLDGLPPTSLAAGSLAEVMARLDKGANGGQATEPVPPSAGAAELHRIAISAITHPPKGAKASPLDSFIGSQAYIAAARIAHLCVPETEPGLAGAVRNTGRVFFTQVKNNIGSKASTLAYHLDTKSIGFDRFAEPLKPAPYVLWEGAVDMTSAEALAQTRAVAKTKTNPVHEFLRDILASGPVLQKIIVERGAAKGISLSQLRRARKAVGAVTFKRRGGNVISPWLWALPEHVPDDVETESTPQGDA